MRTSTWLSARRTAPVLVAGMLVWGAGPPLAYAQCEIAKLLASDGAAGDQFGTSGSISGDVVVVGDEVDDIGVATDAGSAYVSDPGEVRGQMARESRHGHLSAGSVTKAGHPRRAG